MNQLVPTVHFACQSVMRHEIFSGEKMVLYLIKNYLKVFGCFTEEIRGYYYNFI